MRECGDKILTAVALKDNGVPQPDVRIAFAEDSDLNAIEKMRLSWCIKVGRGFLGPIAFQS